MHERFLGAVRKEGSDLWPLGKAKERKEEEEEKNLALILTSF